MITIQLRLMIIPVIVHDLSLLLRAPFGKQTVEQQHQQQQQQKKPIILFCFVFYIYGLSTNNMMVCFGCLGYKSSKMDYTERHDATSDHIKYLCMIIFLIDIIDCMRIARNANESVCVSFSSWSDI